MEIEKQDVRDVDGQCGTCRWGTIDFGPSPSGPKDGVLCSCEAHIKLLCEQQGNDYDLEEFKTYGAVNYFRLEVLAEEKDICPNWQPRPGEVKDQWIPGPDAEQVTTCPWCDHEYEIEGSYSDQDGYVDMSDPYSKHECGHYVCFRSFDDGIEESEEEYLKKILESASGAFWAQVAADYPEVKTGDFPPEAQRAWQNAMDAAVRVWLVCNWGQKPALSDDQIERTDLLAALGKGLEEKKGGEHGKDVSSEHK